MNVKSLKQYALAGAILLGVSFSLQVAAQSRGGGSGHSGGGGHAGGARVGGSHGGGGWHGGGSRGGGDWHRGGGGWHRGGPAWWGLGLGLGLAWDAWALNSPYYDYPYPGYVYPYSSSTVIVEPPPTLVVPPGAADVPQNPPATANWYYCESAKAYYPYVRQCAEAWRVVPAVPPTGEH